RRRFIGIEFGFGVALRIAPKLGLELLARGRPLLHGNVVRPLRLGLLGRARLCGANRIELTSQVVEHPAPSARLLRLRGVNRLEALRQLRVVDELEAWGEIEVVVHDDTSHMKRCRCEAPRMLRHGRTCRRGTCDEPLLMRGILNWGALRWRPCP